MADELSFKIAPIVDDSAGAKKNFQDSINTLVKNMKGANAPKIELTVKKINGKSAIQTFKSEIEQAIGTFGTSIGKNSITNQSKQWKSIFKDSVKDITAPNIDLKPLNSYYKNLEKQANAGTKALQKLNNVQKSGVITKQFTNFDSNIQKFEQLGYTVTEVKTKLNEAVLARQKFESSKTGSVAEQDKAYKSLVVSMNAVKNAMSAISTQNSNDTTFNKNKVSLHQLLLEMQRFEKANDKLRTNSTFSGTYNKLLSDAEKAYGTNNVANVQKLREQFRALQNDMLKAGLEGQRFGTRLQNQFAKFGVYLSAATVFMTIRRVIRSMIADVVELDKVLVNLQVATGYTRDQTKELINTYSEMGKELGATTSQVANAADSWLRQGYSIEQTNVMIKNSLMLSKLGQIDSEESTRALTSATKGYKLAVEDTIGVVDKFTAVDMKAAISAGYIAKAMAETSTSARLAGVDMDRLIGYISTVGEVTQDGAESVGIFYKTLFARMGNIKEGKLIDPETQEDISSTEVVLKNLGIQLRENGGEFRNFGTILDDVSKKWENLGTVNQRAVAVAFSGYRIA